MKILSVTPIISFLVETDETELPTYRRNCAEGWENLWGESWEPVYSSEQVLEQAYQEWLKANHAKQ